MPANDRDALDLVLGAAMLVLERNGGPTGGDEYFGEPDTHVLVRIEDFKMLEQAMKQAAVDPAGELAERDPPTRVADSSALTADLVSALREYGRHKPHSCELELADHYDDGPKFWEGDTWRRPVCTCGFENAKALLLRGDGQGR